MSQMNDYQNRNAFISERRKGYGVERYNRVTSLAENGRYISGRKTIPDVSQGKTSAVTHVKRQVADKLVNGRIQKRHYGNTEKSETNSNTANVQSQSNGKINAANNNAAASERSNQFQNSTQTYSKQAAALKEKLKRDIAADKLNNKKAALKIHDDDKKIYQVKSTENTAAKKYFDHKKSEVEYEFKKKKYRVKKLEAAHLSKMNNTHTLRELAIAGKDIVRPIKQGNAIGTAAVPAKIFLKKLIRKTRLGRFAVKTKDVGSKAAEAAKETGSVSEAMYASGTRFATEAIKSAGHAALNVIGDKHAQNKYLKQVKQAEKKANKYLEKKTENLKKAEATVKSGNAPKKLTKEIEKFKDKETSQKMRDKLASKKQKLALKNKKLDKKIEKKAKKLAKAQKKVEAAKKVAKASKFFKAVFAIGGSSFIFPIIIILIALIILASFFSWLSPFEYELVGVDTGESEKTSAETDEEIINGYLLMVQNYLDVAQANYYLTYGAYCDSYYNWPPAILDWGEFYDIYIQPKIDEAVEAIIKDYQNSIAKAKDDEEIARLEAAMEAEIARVTAQIIDECTKYYQNTVAALNDSHGEGNEYLYVPGENHTFHLEPNTPPDGIWDSGQYTNKECDGTNKFDLQSVEMQTDMTSEDIFALIALSRTISVWKGEDSSTLDENKNVFAQITPKDINKFFKETGFIQIDSKLENGKCNEICCRKLIGSWESGWSWEYYCPGNHRILTGKITLKSKDEMFETVLEKYKVDESGMTREDCESAIEDYMNLFEENFGENYEKHLFGSGDNSRAGEMYNAMFDGEEIINNVWEIEVPNGN